jgi:broad specificity phosphatase PhoE
MVTKLYLVRHAEAEGNVQEFFQGNIDTAVTEKGLRQLDCLAERFRDIPFDVLWSSPFQRAKQTAEAVNRYHGLALHTDFELREINGGNWEGKKWKDLPALYPHEYQLWTEKMWLFCAPEGDAMTKVYARMQDVMQRIAAENAGKTVAVVSHGCALRNFLAFVEFQQIGGLPDVGWSDNTAVSLVEYDCDARTWKLIFKNDSSHLPPELSTLRNSAWNQYEKDET